MSDCKHEYPHGENWVQQTCPYGNCWVEACSFDGVILASGGPVECPCDHFPGWKALRVAEMSKPHVPIKVIGRHGSRVQRARRRHTFTPRTLVMFEQLRLEVAAK